MKRKNFNRNALITSVLSLLLCVSMLVGTTFAWFTDEVTSSGNKIQSGTLDIKLYELQGVDNWVDISGSTDPLFNYDKWEPGYTDVTVLKVKNAGTLALKWAAIVTPLTAENVSALADVIDVYVTENIYELPNGFTDVQKWTRVGTLKEFVKGFAANTQGTLLSGYEATLGIALHMQEGAGNEYQNLSLGTDFDISIFATQLTHEKDFFNNQYDANVNYPAKYEIKETVKVEKNNEGAVVTSAPVTLMSENDTSVVNSVKVDVPAGTRVADNPTEKTTLTASVTSKNNVESGVVVGVDQEAIALDIKVKGLAADNDKLVTVTLQLKTGLTNVVVYHNGVAMKTLDEATEGYSYNATTGTLTVKTMSFSPFDVVFDGAQVVNTADELQAALNMNSNVKLGNDITASEIITLTGSVVLDGNGYTLTSTAGRAINVDSNGNVTIKNLTINASGERSINVVYKPATVFIDNVTATATHYPINIATSAGAAKVAITNSDLTGLNVVNVWGPGSEVTVSDSKITVNGKNEEGYAALFINSPATGAKITATNVIFDLKGYAIEAENDAENSMITINGSSDGVESAVAIIEYNNGTAYTFFTLQGAIDQVIADGSGVVKLLQDIEVVELNVPANITISKNNHTLTIVNQTGNGTITYID